jgi:ATP-dependent Clp protease ATP-binding subunit ClpC
MFERYTEKARRVIFFARYEASQFGSPYIESEHILLGLLREEPAITQRFVAGRSSDEVRLKIEQESSPRGKIATSVDLPLSNECKRILAYAAEEAERLHHRHIGSEHLLLGILREKHCLAAQIFTEFGVQLESARDAARKSSPKRPRSPEDFYCPRCDEGVNDPLTCGDCSAVICRQCGTPLEAPDDLAMG